MTPDLPLIWLSLPLCWPSFSFYNVNFEVGTPKISPSTNKISCGDFPFLSGEDFCILWVRSLTVTFHKPIKIIKAMDHLLSPNQSCSYTLVSQMKIKSGWCLQEYDSSFAWQYHLSYCSTLGTQWAADNCTRGKPNNFSEMFLWCSVLKQIIKAP